MPDGRSGAWHSSWCFLTEKPHPSSICPRLCTSPPCACHASINIEGRSCKILNREYSSSHVRFSPAMGKTAVNWQFVHTICFPWPPSFTL